MLLQLRGVILEHFQRLKKRNKQSLQAGVEAGAIAHKYLYQFASAQEEDFRPGPVVIFSSHCFAHRAVSAPGSRLEIVFQPSRNISGILPNLAQAEHTLAALGAVFFNQRPGHYLGKFP